METFFTSDSHYAHANLCLGSTNWEDKSECRNFDSVNEMNEVLVKAINDRVKENDVLFHLGDWAFGSFDNIKNFRKRINCKNVHLILGNHDRDIRKNRGDSMKLFNSVNPYLKIRIGDDKIILCHYAFRVWDECHRGSWNLCGHSHSRLPVYGKVVQELVYEDESVRRYKPKNILYRQMDVGVDTNAKWEPYSYDELKKIMDNRDINDEDFHKR